VTVKNEKPGFLKKPGFYAQNGKNLVTVMLIERKTY